MAKIICMCKDAFISCENHCIKGLKIKPNKIYKYLKWKGVSSKNKKKVKE